MENTTLFWNAEESESTARLDIVMGSSLPSWLVFILALINNSILSWREIEIQMEIEMEMGRKRERETEEGEEKNQEGYVSKC